MEANHPLNSHTVIKTMIMPGKLQWKLPPFRDTEAQRTCEPATTRVFHESETEDQTPLIP